MFSILSLTDGVKRILTASILILAFVPLVGQHIPAYIEKLQHSKTSTDFEYAFNDMMTDFKSGKLPPFQHEDVMQIVDVARKKAYAEAVLPSVYGWAGSLFGNGRVDQALTFFMESADLYGKQNKKLAQALASFEIALIHHKAENFEEAQFFYEKTLELGEDSLKHRTRINCYNGFALIARNKQDYIAATKAFTQAYSIAEAHRDTVWMGILAGNIGSIHMRKSNYDSALHYYFQNLAFIKHSLEFENEIETYSHLGKIYWAKANYRLAKEYLDSAVAIIDSRQIRFNDFFNPMDYIYETYALLYASTGNNKKAYEFYAKFHQVAQQKQSALNGRSLKQLQSTYDYKQKQSEVELLKKINEANRVVIDQQRYIAIAFAIIILLLGIWGINAYKTSVQRQKLNKKLSSSNAELERLNCVKDKLFSVLSHDLRSPIGTLKSMMRLLEDGALRPEDLQHLYAGLRRQLEVSDNLLESLLQWAKNELSQKKAELGKVVLSTVVTNVVAQLKSAMDDKNIQLHNQLSSDLTAMADRIQLEIILRNLIANAVKFTPKGGIIRIAGKINAKSIEVYVEDNGMGMQEEDVKNLFEPGKNFSRTGTNRETGSGLGLLITKEMISKHGGDIWVNSRQHEGTIFTFTLPLAS